MTHLVKLLVDFAIRPTGREAAEPHWTRETTPAGDQEDMTPETDGDYPVPPHVENRGLNFLGFFKVHEIS